MKKGFVYILKCSDGSYYTGSTTNLDKRLIEHSEGKGANHTKKRLPIELIYFEEFQRIDDAFYREKQIQGWSRTKKEALVKNKADNLPELSKAYKDKVASRASATNKLKFRSNGKLLLTGEYVVLDGAKALALPSKFGQTLEIIPSSENVIQWKSYNEKKEVWFQSKFYLDQNKILKQDFTDDEVANRIIQILTAVKDLNPEFLNDKQGLEIITHQDFNRLWGLGTSSTLINNIADWANVDAYQLLNKTFGGSGYDIACASHNTPITFQLTNQQQPKIEKVNFNPPFSQHLFFVYLNQKQNSRDGIAAYKKLNRISTSIIEDINALTEAIVDAKTLSEFNNLLNSHENMISNLIGQKPIKQTLFEDLNGTVKSLGAWGGDFILASSEDNPTSYFKEKGFETIIPYKDMVL